MIEDMFYAFPPEHSGDMAGHVAKAIITKEVALIGILTNGVEMCPIIDVPFFYANEDQILHLQEQLPG